MPAYVVVQLPPSRSAHGTNEGARDESPLLVRRDVKRLLLEHEAKLIASPRQEGAGNAPDLSATFAVPDMARADKLAAALRGLDGIESAYAKPGEELP